MRTRGQSDMTKQIVAFRNCENAPKKDKMITVFTDAPNFYLAVMTAQWDAVTKVAHGSRRVRRPQQAAYCKSTAPAASLHTLVR